MRAPRLRSSVARWSAADARVAGHRGGRRRWPSPSRSTRRTRTSLERGPCGDRGGGSGRSTSSSTPRASTARRRSSRSSSTSGTGLLDSNLTSVFVACQVFGRAMVERRSRRLDHQHLVGLVGPAAQSGPDLLGREGRAEQPHPVPRRRARAAPDPGQRDRAGFFPGGAEPACSCPRTALRAIVGHTPAGRLGRAGRARRGTIVWLASERASSFVTGAIIRVDGGFSAMTI